jgi:hypothetical protein
VTGKKTIDLHSDDATTAAWNKHYFKASRLDAYARHLPFMHRRRDLIRGLLKAGYDVREYANVWRLQVRRGQDCFSVDLDERRLTLDAISVQWLPLAEAHERGIPVYIRDIAAQSKELPATSMAGVRAHSDYEAEVTAIAAAAGIPGRWGWGDQ